MAAPEALLVLPLEINTPPPRALVLLPFPLAWALIEFELAELVIEIAPAETIDRVFLLGDSATIGLPCSSPS